MTLFYTLGCLLICFFFACAIVAAFLKPLYTFACWITNLSKKETIYEFLLEENGEDD